MAEVRCEMKQIVFGSILTYFSCFEDLVFFFEKKKGNKKRIPLSNREGIKKEKKDQGSPTD
jgi:hypothetical protein